MPDERRATERVDILGALSGAATVIQPLRITQLSLRGALVEIESPLQVNSLHQFRLALGVRSVVVTGRVAHCRVSDVESDAVVYRAGLEFVEAPDWATTAIGQFLETLKAERRA